MTRKQLILFFADYRKAKAITIERDNRRMLVEVNEKFFPADLRYVAQKTGHHIETITSEGDCYLLIRF